MTLRNITSRKMAKLVTVQLLRAYKWAVSPLFPPSCRYVPTCSEYAMEAVERYGALRGTLMAVSRLLRCHPFARGGYDPVVRGVHEHAVECEIHECEIHNCDIQAATAYRKA